MTLLKNKKIWLALCFLSIIVLTANVSFFNFSFARAEETTLTIIDDQENSAAESAALLNNQADEKNSAENNEQEIITSNEFNLTEETASESPITIAEPIIIVICPNGELQAGDTCDSLGNPENQIEQQIAKTANAVPYTIIICPDGQLQAGDTCLNDNLNQSLETATSAASSTPEILNSFNSSTSTADNSTPLLNSKNNPEAASAVIASPNNSQTAPDILAQWVMNNKKDERGQYLGTDDDRTGGAQFMPSGQYQVDKNIAVCAVLADSDNAVNKIYADIYYPENTMFASSSEETASSSLITIQNGNEDGAQERVKILGEKIILEPLPPEDGRGLFCGKIRENNNNLPLFATSTLDYDYDKICGQDGALARETGRVYCGEAKLSYGDPAGPYRTIITVQDKNGLNKISENIFSYLELTAFEADFTNVNYDKVKLNNLKVIEGDLHFGSADDKATVRNIGNTKLAVEIKQNDMGLGKTGESWNVRYEARVGGRAGFSSYYPEETKILDAPLDLRETAKIDLGIYVYNFPETLPEGYAGSMTLSAIKINN